MTIKSKKFEKGIRLKSTTSPATEDGEIRNDSTNPASHRLKVKLEGELEQEIVTADQAQSLSNKTIDSASNIITVDADEATVENLVVTNLKAGVLETDLNNPVDDTNLPSAQAVKSYVAQEVATKDEANEISYDDVGNTKVVGANVQLALDAADTEVQANADAAAGAQATVDNHIADATDAHAASAISHNPAGSSLTSTDVQAAADEIAGRLDAVEADAGTAQTDIDNHIADAADAHTASAITNVPSGNLAATDLQGAVDELQADVDSRALDSALQDHINDSDAAHAASAVSVTPAGNLAATEVQAALEELQTDIDTRALDADLTAHTGATSGVHGVTGDVVGTSDTQTLTNKTIDGATITTPAQLDVKQDTLANLTTYATTATNGQLVFATDTKEMFQVIDAALAPIGGGGATSFEITQAAHGFAVGEGIYHNGTSFVKGQADDEATLAYYVVTEVSDVDTFIAADFGRIEVPAHGYTVGEYYFLSASSAGVATNVEPSTGFSNPLFYVEDANTLQVKVYRPAPVGEVPAKQTQAIVNNQSTPADVTNIVFDTADLVGAKLAFNIYRTDGVSELSQTGTLHVAYKPIAGTFAISEHFSGDDAGLTFSITAAGQLQYVSTNFAGQTTGELKIRITEEL